MSIYKQTGNKLLPDKEKEVGLEKTIQTLIGQSLSEDSGIIRSSMEVLHTILKFIIYVTPKWFSFLSWLAVLGAIKFISLDTRYESIKPILTFSSCILLFYVFYVVGNTLFTIISFFKNSSFGKVIALILTILICFLFGFWIFDFLWEFARITNNIILIK